MLSVCKIGTGIEYFMHDVTRKRAGRCYRRFKQVDAIGKPWTACTIAELQEAVARCAMTLTEVPAQQISLTLQDLDFLDFYEIIYTLYVLEVKTWSMSAQAEQQVAAQNVKPETRAKTWGVRAVLGTMTMGASPTPGPRRA